jgi:hypothetical protein
MVNSWIQYVKDHMNDSDIQAHNARDRLSALSKKRGVLAGAKKSRAHKRCTKQKQSECERKNKKCVMTLTGRRCVGTKTKCKMLPRQQSPARGSKKTKNLSKTKVASLRKKSSHAVSAARNLRRSPAAALQDVRVSPAPSVEDYMRSGFAKKSSSKRLSRHTHVTNPVAAKKGAAIEPSGSYLSSLYTEQPNYLHIFPKLPKSPQSPEKAKSEPIAYRTRAAGKRTAALLQKAKKTTTIQKGYPTTPKTANYLSGGVMTRSQAKRIGR